MAQVDVLVTGRKHRAGPRHGTTRSAGVRVSCEMALREESRSPGSPRLGSAAILVQSASGCRQGWLGAFVAKLWPASKCDAGAAD
jgi:hypothetical protein